MRVTSLHIRAWSFTVLMVRRLNSSANKNYYHQTYKVLLVGNEKEIKMVRGRAIVRIDGNLGGASLGVGAGVVVAGFTSFLHHPEVHGQPTPMLALAANLVEPVQVRAALAVLSAPNWTQSMAPSVAVPKVVTPLSVEIVTDVRQTHPSTAVLFLLAQVEVAHVIEVSP